jgi:hypothetical protein
MSMNSSLRVIWPLLLVLAAVSASAKEADGPHIYSDVRLAEGEVQELVGTELELKMEGTAATGVLRIYDGGCAEHVLVTGSVSGNTLHIAGEGQGYGKIEITGSLQHGRLDGLLRLERTHTSEKIRLKRIKKPHC